MPKMFAKTVDWRAGVPADAPEPRCDPAPLPADGCVVIDAGSSEWRAGHVAAGRAPALCARFEPTVHRLPGGGTAVGRAPRGVRPTSSRGAHDEGVLVQPAVAEELLDAAFGALGLADAFGRRVCMTEALGVPPAARRELAEVLFEGHGVGRVALALDGPCAAAGPAFVAANLGHASTTVVASAGGRALAARRIPYGGAAAAELLRQGLALKYPQSRLPAAALRELLHQAAEVPLPSYDAQARALAAALSSPARHCVRVLLPAHAEDPAAAAQREEAAQRTAQRRRELADATRLRAAKAKEARTAAAAARVAELEAALRHAEEDDPRLLQLEDARRELARLRGDVLPPPPPPDYSLLEVPDAELDAQGLAAKRRLRLLKAGADARDRQRAARDAAEEHERSRRAQLDEKRRADPAAWAAALVAERAALVAAAERRARDARLRADRRSTAYAARARTVSALAADADDASFGDAGADWDAYRDDAAADQSDARVAEIDADLAAHAPDALDAALAAEAHARESVRDRLFCASACADHPADATLVLATERWRAAEGFFAPPTGHAGLAEVVSDAIMAADASDRPLLAGNIVLSGGCAHIPGVAERLLRDVRALLPADVPVRVAVAPAPDVAPFRGLAALAAADALPWVVRSWYDEHGALRLPSVSAHTNAY